MIEKGRKNAFMLTMGVKDGSTADLLTARAELTFTADALEHPNADPVDLDDAKLKGTEPRFTEAAAEEATHAEESPESLGEGRDDPEADLSRLGGKHEITSEEDVLVFFL